MVEDRAAFDAAMEAGERAHLLTVGSPAGTALRVARGSLDSAGRWHENRPDVFLIWRGCRWDGREVRQHVRERAAGRLARLVPRWLRYYVIIQEAAAVSGEQPRKVVPEITWADMAKRLERAHG